MLQDELTNSSEETPRLDLCIKSEEIKEEINNEMVFESEENFDETEGVVNEEKWLKIEEETEIKWENIEEESLQPVQPLKKKPRLRKLAPKIDITTEYNSLTGETSLNTKDFGRDTVKTGAFKHKNSSDANLNQNTAYVTVQYLKTIQFSSLPLEEKIKIKNAGRPKPILCLTSVTRGKGREYKRNFRTETYERNDWLCGCDIGNNLYCYPCLLFTGKDQTEWTKSGVKDLVHLSEKIKKHQSSKSHLSAKLSFNLLGKQDIRQQLNSAFRVSVEKHNEQVKKNRYVLSKIIDCIKFCGAFKLALRGHDEVDNTTNPGIFKGLINFSAELDLALGEHLQQATVFKDTSKDIQNDLLECMLSVCRKHIKQEISESKFVSVMIDEISDISDIFQMVIVLRYTLKNGTPVERFWSFEKPSGQDAVALADCVESVLDYVLIKPDQLISQSYNSTNIMGSVQRLIKEKFPFAYYIHCYAHKLDLILSQTTSVYTNVRIFFSDLSDIANFCGSPQQIPVLEEVVGREVTAKWNFKSGTVKTLYENRGALAECMERIQSTSRQSDVITKAGALVRLMNDANFVFWLTVFNRLMPHVDDLYSQLLKTTTDSFAISRSVTEFENSIQKKRDLILTIRDYELNKKRKKVDERNHLVSLPVQAREVCDAIISEIKRIFSFRDHLEVANLFRVEQFQRYSSTFPSQYVDTAVRTFPSLDKNKLKTELEIIYSRADFREASGAVHLLKFLIENNLLADFSETCLALHAIVTMPIMTAEPDRCFSTLKGIKTFVKSTVDQDRLTALAMLSIGKEMIEDIPHFNELVIEEFISVKGELLHLQYKTCS